MRKKSIPGVISNHYRRVNPTTFLKSERGTIHLSFGPSEARPVPTVVPADTDEYNVRVYDDHAVLEGANGSRVATVFRAEQLADRLVRRHFPGTTIIDTARAG